jgi:protein-L-isoaspartate(D-aspartate) O-methyltransferase
MEHEELIDELIDSGCLKTPLIVEAFRRIDRKQFVSEEYRGEAYENYPLPIGFGQTISQPLTVAFMLELLAPRPGDRILEIGSGSGWATALLAYIVSGGDHNGNGATHRSSPGGPGRKQGKVVAIERIPELQEMSAENVEKYKFMSRKIVELIVGNGAEGYKKFAPYDRVIAAATTDVIPVAWKNQCRIGGRIVIPIGNSIEVHEKFSTGDFVVRVYHGFRFVPLVTDDGGN